MTRQWLTGAAALALGSSPAPAETLRDAILAAVQTNPTLAAAHARQDALGETVAQAKAAGRLTVSADAAAGYDRLSYGTGGFAQVAAALPIWTGGRVPFAVRAAKADVAAGDQSFRDSQAALISDVVTVFAAMLFDQQAVAITRADINLLDRQVAEAKARFTLGSSTRTDVAQLEAQRASAMASLAAANAALDMAAAQYRATVGHEPGALVVPHEPMPALPGTLNQARARATGNNPLVEASLYAADASAARVAAARANGRPDVMIGAGYGYADSYSSFGNRAYPLSMSATVRLHVPILNGGLVASQVRQARAANRADLLGSEAQAREATRGVDAAWAALAGARAQSEADTARFAAADLALKGVRAEYAFGLRTTLDILVADESLRAAQLSLAMDRSNALNAEAALHRATGTLAPALFATE